jgi:hypothetical protein
MAILNFLSKSHTGSSAKKAEDKNKNETADKQSSISALLASDSDAAEAVDALVLKRMKEDATARWEAAQACAQSKSQLEDIKRSSSHNRIGISTRKTPARSPSKRQNSSHSKARSGLSRTSSHTSSRDSEPLEVTANGMPRSSSRSSSRSRSRSSSKLNRRSNHSRSSSPSRVPRKTRSTASLKRTTSESTGGPGERLRSSRSFDDTLKINRTPTTSVDEHCRKAKSFDENASHLSQKRSSGNLRLPRRQPSGGTSRRNAEWEARRGTRSSSRSRVPMDATNVDKDHKDERPKRPTVRRAVSDKVNVDRESSKREVKRTTSALASLDQGSRSGLGLGHGARRESRLRMSSLDATAVDKLLDGERRRVRRVQSDSVGNGTNSDGNHTSSERKKRPVVSRSSSNRRLQILDKDTAAAIRRKGGARTNKAISPCVPERVQAVSGAA